MRTMGVILMCRNDVAEGNREWNDDARPKEHEQPTQPDEHAHLPRLVRH